MARNGHQRALNQLYKCFFAYLICGTALTCPLDDSHRGNIPYDVRESDNCARHFETDFSTFLAKSHQEDGLHLWCREFAQSTLVHAHLLLFDLDGRQNDKLNVVSSQHVSTASYFSISQ